MTALSRTPALVLRAAVLEPLLANAGRVALSAIGIALGVALGAAVHLINDSAAKEFGLAVRSLAGEANLVVRGPRTGFSEELYPRIARMPGVQAVSPALEAAVPVKGKEESLELVGLDPFRAAQVQPSLMAGIGGALGDLFARDTVLLTPAAAEWLGLKQGDTFTIFAGTEARVLRVAGLLPASGYRQRLALMDIGSAQPLLERLGILNRLDIRLHPGTDPEGFRSALAGILPPGVDAATPEVEAERGAALSRAYRLNLNMLALVALFTGGFLVFSTLALAVLRRRRELALLRVLGVTRDGIILAVLLEGALIGAVGAALGVFLGQLLAGIVVRELGADLGAGYFSTLSVHLRSDPVALAIFLALGIAAAALGALVPAATTAATPPAIALRAGDQDRAQGRLSGSTPGAALMAIAAGLAFAPPVGDMPLFGYLSIALLLVGAVLLMPRAAALALGLLQTRHPLPAWLAVEQLRGRPGQTSLSMAAILVSVSLMVSMAIMVASFRQSLDDWLARVVPADLYLRSASGGESAYFTSKQQERMRATPGVREVGFLRNQTVWLDARRAPVSLLARDVDPSRPERALPLVGTWIRPEAGQPPPAWISETVQDLYGFRVGETVHLPLAGQQRSFTVAGVWRDYARQNGAICIERETYLRLTGDPLANDAAIWLAPGHDRARVEAALREQLRDAEGLEIVGTGRIRALSLAVFDRTFAVTYALEAVAVLIGLFGISVGIGSQVLARRGEFGMLRHVGMTRGQIGAMLALEGALTSALGILFGFLLGWIVSLVLVHVINRQSFHWSMDMHAPWLLLAVLAAVLITASAVTAVASGRQAMGGDVVRAVREDW